MPVFCSEACLANRLTFGASAILFGCNPRIKNLVFLKQVVARGQGSEGMGETGEGG